PSFASLHLKLRFSSPLFIHRDEYSKSYSFTTASSLKPPYEHGCRRLRPDHIALHTIALLVFPWCVSAVLSLKSHSIGLDWPISLSTPPLFFFSQSSVHDRLRPNFWRQSTMNTVLICILALLVFTAIPGLYSVTMYERMINLRFPLPASVYYLFILKSNRDDQQHHPPTNVRRGRYENRVHIWSAVSAPYTFYPELFLRAPPSAVQRVSRSFSSRTASTHDETELLLQEYRAAAYPSPPTSPV
ncbi:hypothetical protein FB45DRAFT_889138, partial [Roridomyces roridus]